jgi:L-fuculose-phosphate aldolase
MADLDRLRADIVEIGKRLYTRGYCASNDGNITIRFADDRILTTPKSVSSISTAGRSPAIATPRPSC